MSETSQICPWCDTEIIWDPEIGPEAECPHCGGELGEYRTVPVGGLPVSREEDEELDDDTGFDGDEDLDSELDEESDYPDGLFEREELPEGYEQQVALYGSADGGETECEVCRAIMLLAGTETVGAAEAGFRPFVPEGASRSFLHTPFKLDVYLCPACFYTKKVLSQEDRRRVVTDQSERGGFPTV